MDDLEKTLVAEIDRVHVFFEKWFAGRVPHEEEHFGAFRDALDPHFAQVSPDGRFRPYANILADVWKHWNWFPGDPDYKIWISNARVHHVMPPNHAYLTFEEWHRYKGEDTCRTCSALLVRRPGPPGGVAWLAMHESRVPAP